MGRAQKACTGVATIIIGAAQGIGRDIAQTLAKDGLDWALFDLPGSKEQLEELASSLRKEFGTKVVPTIYGDPAEDDVKRPSSTPPCRSSRATSMLC
ncbi:hypothetical protein OH76DRAFT_1397885 [Lentinus brumalis]|uniref:NAD(P)-binding protein n=1 Tax=Lentinus brumalis TaxID=2498619 RepID=A0A371DPT9_9APHY|nr:hypothetical protein OH76DRAFT_1397885 [Polyporus brumalis]